ncbi:putative hemolysin [Breznakibacter xylanolyticus]|uniref:Putative hemolysin n=1 Tax=Breznakibacter xylanolyticus TaxID=990 RepID=A0A2W7N383_9BACT|nr:GNAT family N-acetyltransferase [Breznakibacter xylanolyticus]PZX14540.1 putative hemolysin [Breznakibacter xylanolyticus]
MSAMEDIIPAIPREIIEGELTRERFVRKTNKGNNLIYDFDAHESPILMQEVGRLRELSFRLAGGGTGKSVDIDEYDTNPTPYRQLIVWDPEEREMLGGYRYIMGDAVLRDPAGTHCLATSHMFHFSDAFIQDYLGRTIELGRSFVQPQYQSSKAGAKSLYALDNLWDGLGGLVVKNPQMEYFFGKVTMYTHYNQEARDLILGFMRKYFGDKDQLVYPFHPVELKLSQTQLDEVFVGQSFMDDYKVLNKKVRDLGENIPPLINAYMNLSPSMRTFGTAINDGFGDVEETGIIIRIRDLYKAKVERHFDTYNPNDQPDQR